jgi:hypothetical protein
MPFLDPQGSIPPGVKGHRTPLATLVTSQTVTTPLEVRRIAQLNHQLCARNFGLATSAGLPYSGASLPPLPSDPKSLWRLVYTSSEGPHIPA